MSAATTAADTGRPRVMAAEEALEMMTVSVDFQEVVEGAGEPVVVTGVADTVGRPRLDAAVLGACRT